LSMHTTRNLLTSDPSFWSLDGHCCSIYDPLLTKNSWSAVERHWPPTTTNFSNWS
jgi:hypothetical protein